MSLAFTILMRIICNLFWLSCLVVCGAGVASLPPTNELPFDYSEGLLWVRVEVPQSVRPLNFLFDTGAERSVLNASTAKALGISGGEKIRVQGVDAATTGRWPVALAAKAGDVTLPANYLSLDLSRLAASCERPLDGLLGADFIQGKVVEIDFQSHRIHFLEQKSSAKTDIDLPLKFSGTCCCAPARINGGQTQWLRVDTGCATAFQWVTADAGIPVDSQRPAIGLAGLTISQTRTTVSLGGKEFEQVPTGLHRRAIFAGESGLLGNGLLDHFKSVTIDTKTKRLVLFPLSPAEHLR